MPIGDLDVPVIGKNVVIAILVQSHILIATFILGAALIAPTAELPGVATFFAFFMILVVVGGSVLFTYWISKDD